MRVLAIDTALAACSAAVLDTEYGGIIASESLPMVRGRAEHKQHLLLRGAERNLLERAIGQHITALEGFAAAADKPAVGLSTLSAYAAPHLAADDRFPVIAAIDARHAHVYLQVFSPGGHSFTTPRLASLREAVQAASEAQAFIVGSAAQLVADAMSQAGAPPAAVDPCPAPDIAWVARMGAVVPEGQSPPKPQYLRAPDAQPQNAAQLPRR